VASGDGLIQPLRRAADCTGIDPALLGLGDIDWSAPWLADWRAWGEPLARQIVGQGTASTVLTQARHAPVAFVPQAMLPEGVAYETFIRETAQVPTREGLHDFFNALCWMHFPQAKARLNRLQAAEIARDGVQARRGPVRDAITVLDENGVLIQASDALWQALCEHRWHDALVMARGQWSEVRLWVFGHATLEKLVRPYKSITAHLWRVPQTLQRADIDPWLAQDLQPERLAAKPFAPLPLLGVPGWWTANVDPGFYDDPAVFRPARQRRASPEKPPSATGMPSIT